MQTHFFRRDIVGFERMGFVRSLSKLGDRQTEENVVHRGIADEAHFEDVVLLDVGLFAEFCSQVVYAIDYGIMKLGEFFFGLGVCDSADNIVAETCLGIEDGFGCLALTGGHID
jgi:hypothetical protein